MRESKESSREKSFDALRREGIAQFEGGAAEHRMAPKGGDVAERVEDERALGQAWMRQDEAWFVDDQIVHREEIEVQHPGGISLAARPTAG